MCLEDVIGTSKLRMWTVSVCKMSLGHLNYILARLAYWVNNIIICVFDAILFAGILSKYAILRPQTC